MKDQAQKVWEAYEAEDTYNFPKDGVAAVIRAIVNEFQYCDDYGNAFVNADDLEALADELEAL